MGYVRPCLPRTGRSRSLRGFSLIELCVVVAIILVILAIAIPNLQQARIAANETSAAESVRVIVTAEYAYSTAYSSFATQLSDLSEQGTPCVPHPTGACIIDSSLANATPGNGSRSGYVFELTGVNGANGFVAAASPRVVYRTGNKNFCASTDGVLRSAPATAAQQPVTTPEQCSTYAVLEGTGGHSGGGGDGGGGEGGGGGDSGGGEGGSGEGHD